MLKLVTIIGARPQFIKAATVSRAIAQHNRTCEKDTLIKEVIVHTGQHYDENMSKIFFEELQISKPDYNLGIGSDSHGRQTGRMLAAIEEVLIQEKPALLLTYGDTNSTLAGALAASKLHILSAHVEAGLRSYNRRMPEEINRLVADELSNLLFCPTDTAMINLRREGIGCSQSDVLQRVDVDTQLVFNVGDVMYDSILFNERLAQERSDILNRLGLCRHPDKPRGYCLVTIHRPENTDLHQNLENILDALTRISATGIKVIFPLHPRTRNRIKEFGLEKEFDFLTYGPQPNNPINSSNPITVINPVGYLDMLQLEKHAWAILTDSGGVQKEAYLLEVPCITLRNETEWVETVDKGWNILTGADMQKITAAFARISNWHRQGPPFQTKTELDSQDCTSALPGDTHPYGDGRAAEKIVDIISKIILNTG